MNSQPLSKVTLQLRRKWEACGEGLLRGHFFYNGILDNHDLMNGSTDAASLLSKLRSTYGFFSCILPFEDGVILMVDHARSYPLYYRILGEKIIVTDDPISVIEENKDKSSIGAILEFLCTGYVTGENTIVEGVKQLETGTCVIFKEGEIAKCKYYDFKPNIEQSIDAASYHSAFENALDNAFQRLGIISKGRQIVVPLSGGYDSRLIALYLRRFNFDNVIAFTYGRPGNRESEISKSVARELGYDCYFVPYSNEIWRKVSHSSSWLDFCSYAFQLSSIPHLQDFPAIESLLDQRVIEKDAIITPGHRLPQCVSDFNDREAVSKDQIVRQIMSTKYKLWKFDAESPLQEEFYSRISDSLGDFTMVQSNVAASIVENWKYKEPISKLLVHSVRSYEHAGLDWWLPLLDQEFVSFWQRPTFDCYNGEKYYRKSVHLVAQEVIKDVRKMETPIHEINPEQVAMANMEPKSSSFLGAYVNKAKKGKFLNKMLYSIGYSRERDYENDPYAFFGLVEKKEFMRTYTGTETINSYIALDIAKQFLDPEAIHSPELEMIQSIRIYKSNMWEYLKKYSARV